MKQWIRWAAGCMLFAGLAGAGLAADRATPEEAKALAEQAAEHVGKVGPEKAFKDFNDGANPVWRKKDLYVFAYDMAGQCLANGGNGKLVGTNQIDLKDPNGKPVVREFISAAGKGAGSVEYVWSHPQTQSVEGKVSYIVKVKNFDGFVGVGAYR
jgi:hypothetical protein